MLVNVSILFLCDSLFETSVNAAEKPSCATESGSTKLIVTASLNAITSGDCGVSPVIREPSLIFNLKKGNMIGKHKISKQPVTLKTVRPPSCTVRYAFLRFSWLNETARRRSCGISFLMTYLQLTFPEVATNAGLETIPLHRCTSNSHAATRK